MKIPIFIKEKLLLEAGLKVTFTGSGLFGLDPQSSSLNQARERWARSTSAAAVKYEKIPSCNRISSSLNDPPFQVNHLTEDFKPETRLRKVNSTKFPLQVRFRFRFKQKD